MTSFSSGRKPELHLLMHRGNFQGCVHLRNILHRLVAVDGQEVKADKAKWGVPAVAPTVWCFLKDFTGKGVVVRIPHLGVQKWSFLQAAKSSRASNSTCTACDRTLGASPDKPSKLFYTIAYSLSLHTCGGAQCTSIIVFTFCFLWRFHLMGQRCSVVYCLPCHSCLQT